jgi:hypothetical protein
MRKKLFVCFLCSLLFDLAGCEKSAISKASSESQAKTSPASSPSATPGSAASAPPDSAPITFDACGLITKEEIAEVEGSPVTNTKNSGHAQGGFLVSQCFYAAAEFSKSVSLEVRMSDPDSPARRSPREFWKETFDRYAEEKESGPDVPAKDKKEADRTPGKSREEEKSTPPKKVDGVGEEAYWTGTRVGGALYVLKGDVFIRVSVGGPDKEEVKINKSKALAQKAIERL